MTTPVTGKTQNPTTQGTLYMACELSEKTWKLGFTTGHGQKPRARNVPARHQEHILDEIAQAKRRFGLPETAPVVSCYEAGRDGCWLHRFVHAHGITNHVVDSSAIEVNRRNRRAKSDGLDVRKLVTLLIRLDLGDVGFMLKRNGALLFVMHAGGRQYSAGNGHADHRIDA